MCGCVPLEFGTHFLAFGAVYLEFGTNFWYLELAVYLEFGLSVTVDDEWELI